MLRAAFEKQPSTVLFIAFPGLGAATGNRHSCSVLRNIIQLAFITLSFFDRHVVIDGATGNPAWRHPALAELRAHPRISEPRAYYWCSAGVTLDGKPFRWKSRSMSTLPLSNVNQWKHCCAKPFEEHSTSKNSVTWGRTTEVSRIYPSSTMKGLLADISHHVEGQILVCEQKSQSK